MRLATSMLTAVVPVTNGRPSAGGEGQSRVADAVDEVGSGDARGRLPGSRSR
jgi:hypothetical protein